MTISLLHSIVTYTWGLICFIMGINLLVFNIPKAETLNTYRSSARGLAINYLVLSVLVFLMEFLGLRNSPDDVFPFPILIIYISQGLIFSYVLVSLYIPKYFAIRNIKVYNLYPLLGLVFLYCIEASIFGDPVIDSVPHFFLKLSHPTVIIRFLLVLFTVYQIVIYCIIVKRIYRRYVDRLANYYSQTLRLKIVWARSSFYFAVLIGVTALASGFFKDVFIDLVFTIVFCIYYFLFALLYMQYKNVYSNITSKANISPINAYFMSKVSDKFDWEKAKNEIISKKLFLNSSVSVDDFAKRFGTNRTTFSSSLNRSENMSFNSFINLHRVEYAKILLKERDELNIVEIAQLCGYSEQSNFTRAFKKVCDETPAAWKERNK